MHLDTTSLKRNDDLSKIYDDMEIYNADDLLYLMIDTYPPNLFLFHNYIEEVVKQGKKHIKTAPFDNVDPDTLFNNDNSQYFDLYHTYFLAAMGYTKTREISCLNYEKLVRQQLIDKSRLPVSMISSVLTACANVGGSTSGSSSLGSASLNNNPQNQNLYIGNLVKSILLHTYQPISELNVGLNYLLEGTRKKYSFLYTSMLQEVYSNFLVRLRQPAINRFVNSYLNSLVDQIQGHFNDANYVFASRKIDEQTGKMDIPVYVDKQKFGKFGRCYICRKQADHYMKEEFIPICSINCKERVKELLQQCQSNEQFNVLAWIIDNMSSGDQIIYSFLLKELQACLQNHTLSWVQLVQIIKGLSAHIETSNLHKSLLSSLSLIITKWQHMIPSHQVSNQKKEVLQNYFKIYYIEILNVIQELPIAKEQIDFIIFFNQILKHEPTLLNIFNRYDSRFFQPNILGRMLNLLSQYAKKFEAAVDGLHGIVKILSKRYVQRGVKIQDWPFAAQCSRKKQLKKAITMFNKKPHHGIKHFKKIFQNFINQSRQKEPINQPESPIKLYSSSKKIQVQVQQIQKDEAKEQIQDKLQIEAQKQQEEVQIVEPVQSQEQKQIKEQHEQSVLQQERIILPSTNDKQEVEKDRVKVTPYHIALFIRQFTQSKSFYQLDQRQPIKIPQLSQAMVGQYFGQNNQQARQVALAYLSTFVFEDYQIDDTMRIILNSFSLPKETQMVDRVIGDIAKRLVGLYGLNNDTESYQYFYLLLMVQTTNHNPNVRESERLKFDSFLKMCQSMIGRIPEKAERDYNRILEHSLNVKIKYSEEQFFSRKYLGQLDRWSYQLFGQGEKGSQAKNLLTYIWEYLVIGLVWPGNSKGLLQSVILLGKEGLAAEQRAFFEALRKEGPLTSSRDAILKIGIQYGNQLHGDLWNTVISLIYRLENQNEFSSAVLDKLFTNSGRLNAHRLRDFLRALLQFSKSEIKQDSLYTRELFVLRHINSLLQYNIPRFAQLSLYIWPLLQDYFKDICLHPRKEVSMGAIDSFKQLALKLLKLQQQAVPHEALMQTFLHIFERSCLQMKDFIANVLLNVITVDLRDGWESIYQILDILDTKDKQLVVKILGRLMGQIGLERLTNLQRLHAICIKQLRICGQEGVVQQLLAKLWQLSSYINDLGIWLQTIRSIKDIFKISLNNDILQVFIRMCNKCLEFSDKQIFTEIVDIFMFLLDLKGSNSKIIAVLLTSLQSIKQVSPHFIVKFVGGSYGFLSVFQLYLSSHLKLPFAIFLKTYFIQTLLPILREETNLLQFEQFSLWCINQYYDNLPLELINLKQKDRDFEKTLSSLMIQKNQIAQKQGEVELIEFHLSNKEYKQKSIIHLVFLDIVQGIYKQGDKFERVKAKVEESVIDSYECAYKINKFILMRNFLWRNGFLSSKHLPGLHRQEHRTLVFILREFSFTKIYHILKSFLRHYLTMTLLYHQIKNQQASPKSDKKKNSGNVRQSEQKEGRNLTTYIADAELWLNEAHRGVCSSMIKVRQQVSLQSNRLQECELWELVNISLQLLSLAIPVNVCNETSQTLKSLYEVVV